MRTSTPLSKRARCALGLAAILAMPPRALAVPAFWDGGGANNNWSNDFNWVDNFILDPPRNDGTDDIMMAGTVRLTPLVDIDFDILSLQFNASAGAFDISNSSGAALFIRGGGIINNDADLQTLRDVSLGANHTWNAAAGRLQVNHVRLGGLTTGYALTVTGGFDTAIPAQISGSALTNSGSIILNSTASLTLSGIASNTFTGPVTVNGGTLRMSKGLGAIAVPGNLIIGDGAGSDVVRLLLNNQVADTSHVTINSSGLLDLNAQTETINNLTMNGGTLATNGGSLTVNGNISATGGTLAVGSGVINSAGNLTMNGGSLTTAGGAINAGGSISLTGNTVSLESGTLSFGSGSIASTLVSGTSGMLKGTSLAASNSTVSLGGSGKIDVARLDLTAATISRVKARFDFANMEVYARAANTSSVVDSIDSARADAPLLLHVENGGAINDLVTGPIGLDSVPAFGLGLVTKSGAGQLHLVGGMGIDDMFISDGTVLLDSTNLAIADWAIAGTLRYARSTLLHDLSRMFVIEGGSFDLDGFTDTIGFLDLRGGVATSGATGSLTVARVSSIASASTSLISGRTGIGFPSSGTGTIQVEDGPATIDLDAPAVISAILGSITVQGPGTLRLSGANDMGSSMAVQGGARILAANDQAFGTAVVTINNSTLAADGAPRTIGNSITMIGSSGISGDQPLTLNGSFGIAMNATLTKSGTATLSLSGPQLHAAGATLAIDEGAVGISTDAGLNLMINVTGSSGRASFLSRQHIAALNVTAGEAVIETGGSRVVVAKSLTVDTTDALIDVWEHAIIIDYTGGSPLASIKSAITTAYAGGSWSGFGITSSLANNSTHGVGYAESGAIFTSFPAIFAGEAVDDTAVLVRFTRYGDANLDQVVNLADFNRLAANFGTSSGATWSMGDFTYDGIVNLSDFNRLAANFGLAAGPDGPTPQDWASLASAVPEPAGPSLLAAAGVMLTRPRRRQLARAALFAAPASPRPGDNAHAKDDPALEARRLRAGTGRHPHPATNCPRRPTRLERRRREQQLVQSQQLVQLLRSARQRRHG